MRYRIVTDDDATDYDSGIKATIAHTRNICANRTSLLMETFEDALPEDTVRGPVVIDIYTASLVRTERERRLTWTLGQPQPAFPRESNSTDIHSPEEWRTRAFYYALGQIESLWELSPLVEGDAVSFSYHWQQLVAAMPSEATNLHMREAWVAWEAGRRADLEQHGRPTVEAIRLPRGEGIDYLAGGEHDPTLGPDMSNGR